MPTHWRNGVFIPLSKQMDHIVSKTGTIFKTKLFDDYYFKTVCKRKTNIGIEWTIQVKPKKDK